MKLRLISQALRKRPFFYIDRRSLDLFYAALGLVLLIDLLIRIPDLKAHYTHEGLLPLSALMQHEWNIWYWSLANLSDQFYFQLFLFLVVMMAAVGMVFQYRLRWMLLVAWVGLLSIQHRNPVVLQGGDDLLRMLLFWSLFLPARSRESRACVSGTACTILLLQIVSVYHFSAWYKSLDEWWRDGTAIYYALQLDQIARPLGSWIAQHPEWCALMTRCAFILEASLLPLFLLPWPREYIRMTLFFSLVGFNVGILTTMMIGVFPHAFIAASFLFIPHTFWEAVSKKSLYTTLQGLRQQWIGYARSKPMALWKKRAAYQIFPMFCALMVLGWNIAAIPRISWSMPSWTHPLMLGLRLDQSWGMFAPTVFKEDGWYVLEAELRNGRRIDLMAPDDSLSFAKPDDVLDRYPNDRWRKYGEQLYMAHRAHLRPFYADYLIRDWNQNHADDQEWIQRLWIYYMREITLPPGQDTRIEVISLHQQSASASAGSSENHIYEAQPTGKKDGAFRPLQPAEP